MRPASLYLAAVLLVPHTVHGQADPATLVREGVARRRAGADAEALPLFEQAYAAAPTPANAALLGLCETALEHYASARAHLRAALAAEDDPWIARNRVALERARAIADTPAPAHGEPTGTSAPIAREQTTVAPRQLIISTAAPTPAPTPVTAAHSTLRLVAWAAVASGGVLGAGGIAAWIAREVAVDGFNARGCRVGDPNLPANCDVGSARTARDVGTALAATGLVAGLSLATIGTVGVLATGRPLSVAHRRSIACGLDPSAWGASCAGHF